MSSNRPNKWELDPHLVKCMGLLHKSRNLKKGDEVPLQKELEKALFEELGIKRDYTAFFQSQLPPREQAAEVPSTSGSGHSASSSSSAFSQSQVLPKEQSAEVPSTSGSGHSASPTSSVFFQTQVLQKEQSAEVPSTSGSAFFESQLQPKEKSRVVPSTSGSGHSSSSSSSAFFQSQVLAKEQSKGVQSASGSEHSATSSSTAYFYSQLIPAKKKIKEVSSTSGHSARSSKSTTKKKTDPVVEISDSDENLDLSSAKNDEELESIIGNDLLCVKCRKMNMEAKNCLIECCECHRLFHQLCHRPPVLKYRQTWACIDCQNLRYMGLSLAERSIKLKELQKKQAIEISKKLSQQKITHDESSSSGSCSSSSSSSPSHSGQSSPKRGPRFDSLMAGGSGGTSSSSESNLVVDESSLQDYPPPPKKSIKGVQRFTKTKKK